MNVVLHLSPETTALLTALMMDRQTLQQILQNTERLITMSQTNQERIDAANAAQQAALDAIQTDITAIAAELQAAIPAPGTVPSQASLDAMQANVDRLNAVKTALDALVVPAPTA